MSTHRDDVIDAIQQYGRETADAVESFRCAEPDLPAAIEVMDLYVDEQLQQLRAQIAAEIEGQYLGPDSGRLPDGNDAPDAHCRNAYDEGLYTAADIARGTTERTSSDD